MVAWNRNRYGFLAIFFPALIGGVLDTFSQNRAQTPTPPFFYRTLETSYKNRKDGTTIGGTLTVPKGKGPFPAVILLPGSGPTDRDQTMLGHKPFAVIADYLTRQGVAVLRVDSRGTGKTSGNYYNSTGHDLAADVLMGIEFLQGLKEVDRTKIGLIGHSLGGLVAALTAESTSDVKFIVLLAAPAFSDDESSEMRILRSLRAQNPPEAEKQRILVIFRKFKELQKQNADDTEMLPVVRELLKSLYPVQLSEKDLDSAVAQQLAVQKTPYAKFFATYQPRESLQKITCPVLAVNGSLDQVVSAKDNLSRIYDSLGQNKDATVVEIYGVNHLFQTATTGNPAEYASIDETIAPKVLMILASWIKNQT